MNTKEIRNPILPGAYPDPSICRVGDDFYIACSSFELCPGIPIFHSRDLANWELVSYAIDKKNGLHVEANVNAGGIMAPTLRYHDGVFYIINANFCDKGNYIITAEDPAGPWSEPVWLTDVPGIDASLFFDEDGKAYIIGTGNVVERSPGTMERGIWLSQIDLEQMKLVGEKSVIWDSALRGAASPEAPHLYKVGEYYYLLIAEGGTDYYHSATVARSKELRGWYEGCPGNPVLTHRHLGHRYPITNIGHADFVDTPSGNWYAVMLGSRTVEGYHKNFGRETFLCPVEWERGWPVFSPGSGKVEWSYPADETLPWSPVNEEFPVRDDFSGDTLDLCWNFWGTPYGDFWRLQDMCLYLKCLPKTTCEPLRWSMDIRHLTEENACVSLVARKQRHLNVNVSCHMQFLPQEREADGTQVSDEAGMIVLQACNHQILVARTCEEGEQILKLVLVTSEMNMLPFVPDFESKTIKTQVARVPYDLDYVTLKLCARGQDYLFYYGEDEPELFLGQVDARNIIPEGIGGMAGTMFGMYASGNGLESQNEAAFDWFDYEIVE